MKREKYHKTLNWYQLFQKYVTARAKKLQKKNNKEWIKINLKEIKFLVSGFCKIIDIPVYEFINQIQ